MPVRRLVDERRLSTAGAWQPREREADKVTFEVYAEAWLRDRGLKPRTRQRYQALLDRHLFPTSGHHGLREITPDFVRTWLALSGVATPTLRAHAYRLMRTIPGTAKKDELITR